MDPTIVSRACLPVLDAGYALPGFHRGGHESRPQAVSPDRLTGSDRFRSISRHGHVGPRSTSNRCTGEFPKGSTSTFEQFQMHNAQSCRFWAE